MIPTVVHSAEGAIRPLFRPTWAGVHKTGSSLRFQSPTAAVGRKSRRLYAGAFRRMIASVLHSAEGAIRPLFRPTWAGVHKTGSSLRFQSPTAAVGRKSRRFYAGAFRRMIPTVVHSAEGAIRPLFRPTWAGVYKTGSSLRFQSPTAGVGRKSRRLYAGAFRRMIPTFVHSAEGAISPLFR
jgi:hypothetical protein